MVFQSSRNCWESSLSSGSIRLWDQYPLLKKCFNTGPVIVLIVVCLESIPSVANDVELRMKEPKRTLCNDLVCIRIGLPEQVEQIWLTTHRHYEPLSVTKRHSRWYWSLSTYSIPGISELQTNNTAWVNMFGSGEHPILWNWTKWIMYAKRMDVNINIQIHSLLVTEREEELHFFKTYNSPWTCLIH